MRKIGALDPAALRDRDESVLGDDNVIKDGNATQLSYLPQSLGEVKILPRRGGLAGGVVVAKNDGGDTLFDEHAKYVPGVNLDAGQTSARQTGLETHAVPDVEAERPEFLDGFVAKTRSQMCPDVGRLSEPLSESWSMAGRPSSQLESGSECAGPCRSDPVKTSKCCPRRTPKTVESAVRFKQISRHVDYVLRSVARAEQHGNELGIGQSRGSVGHHAFAGSVAGGKGFQVRHGGQLFKRCANASAGHPN